MKLLKFSIFIIFGLNLFFWPDLVNAKVILLPLGCNNEMSSRIDPYVTEIEKKLPKKVISQLRNLKQGDLINGSSDFSKALGNLWFNTNYMNHELIKLYAKEYIGYPKSIIEDMKENIWAKSNHKKNRCSEVVHKFDLVDSKGSGRIDSD